MASASASTISTFIATLALLFLALLLYLTSQRHLSKTKAGILIPGRAPPAHRPRPVWDIFNFTAIGAFQSAVKEERFPEFFVTLYADTSVAQARKVKTLDLQVPGANVLSTYDPKNVQAMLAFQFDDFVFGRARIGALQPMLGAGIFTSDGKVWEHNRSILRPQFTRDQTADLDLEGRLCEDLLRALPAANAQGWTDDFDIQPYFFNLTMDSATESFFGEGTHLLASTSPSEDSRFAEAFDRCQDTVTRRGNLGDYYWLFNPSSFKADLAEIFAWADARVSRALARYASGKQTNRYVFLDMLIRETQDPIELRHQLLSVLVAGRDTTASLLGWTYYLLSRHPAEYTKLRHEILALFGTESAPKEIDYTKLRQCKPLQNLLNEVLRLFPSVPFNMRQAKHDTSLPRGGGPNGSEPIHIPKGTAVFYNLYLMHTDTDIWGADAADFKPDRWYGLKTGWEYLPFNGGPRFCLGQMLALTNAAYCLVRMMQRFEACETREQRPLKVRSALNAQSANGVWVRLRRAGA